MKWEVLLGLLLALATASALYEDQAGKWDWRQRFVGRVKQISSYHLSSAQSIVVTTDKNVLASIFVRNGSINWRQVFERRDSDLPSNAINAVSSGDEHYGLNTKAEPQSLITVSGNGRYVRSWDPLFGVLEWETSVPQDIIKDIDDGTNQLLVHIKQSSKQITLAKFYTTPSRKLELNILEVKTRATKKSPVIPTGSWFQSIDDCSFVSSDYLICLDKTNLVLQFLAIGESKNFVPAPLVNFGLVPAARPKYLKIVKLSHQEDSKSPAFAVDLGGDGLVVLKIQDRAVKLLKVLPKVEAIAVAPINLLESSSSNRFGVFVLISKPQELQKRDEDVGIQQFKVGVFDLESWEDLKELAGQFEISSASPVRIEQMIILPFFNHRGSKFQYKVLLASEDQALILASSQGKISWIREESLSSIVSTEIIDLPLSELDASIEQAFGFSSNVATQFMARITSQIDQIQISVANYIELAMQIIAPPPARRASANEDDDADFEVTNKVDKSNLVRDYFGLHKIIITMTKPGKVFGLDTFTGKTIWSFYDEDLGKELQTAEKRLPIFVQRTTAHFPHSAFCTVITKQGLIVSFNPITGEVIEKMRMPSKVKQALLMSHPDDTYLKGLIVLSDNNEVAIYPPSAIDAFIDNKGHYFLLVGHEKTGLIEGFNFASATRTQLKASLIWSLMTPVSEFESHNRLDIFFKRQNEHVHSQGRVLGDRNVLYKYLNPNLVVIASEGAESGVGTLEAPSKQKSHFVNIYLVDAVTGAIVHSTSHKRAKGPVYLVHTENSVIYSYYNEKSRRTEISSLELFEGYTQTNGSAFSSLERPFIRPPLIEHETFIFPTGMLAMVDTQTEKGITNKHLLIALPSGGILELPKAFLDPRRPIHPTADHREEGLIPYIPELPIPSEGIINYNKTLSQVKAIEVAPSGLESTCLVFAHGLDIFYTRVTPSKTFDILKDDFDHLLIAVVLSILMGLGYVSKWLAARKTLKNAWK